MGANTRKNKQLRRKSRNKGKLKFKCHATRLSWKKGSNVARNLKAIGLSYNPNNIGLERKKRHNKLVALYHASKKDEQGDKTNKNVNKVLLESRLNDDASNDYDYNPKDYDAFIDGDNNKSNKNKNDNNSNPLLLNIPDSALKNKLNLALNQNPANLFKPIPRHKREYYQRLINKYGRDYNAMHSDIKLNFFQWTVNKIRRDIKHYRYEFKFPKRRERITF